jgi:hypothetical protein
MGAPWLEDATHGQDRVTVAGLADGLLENRHWVAGCWPTLNYLEIFPQNIPS